MLRAVQHGVFPLPLVLVVLTLLSALNCFGQSTGKHFRYPPPKTDAEIMKYIDQYLKPKINDTLITRLFEEADLVFEGEIVDVKALLYQHQNEYLVEPYKLFKGIVSKNDMITIIANWKPQNSVYDIGEWSHEKDEVGIFFVKKDKNDFRFINPVKSWISYPDLLSIFRHQMLLSDVLYSKIVTQKGAFYKETKFFTKKKGQFSANAKETNSFYIDHFSQDTVPAGILNGTSTLQIIGQGFGAAKGRIYLPDANSGGNVTFRLHPDDHILSWSDELVEIIVPSMGYASDSQDGRSACAGTGLLGLYKAISLGGEYTEYNVLKVIEYFHLRN